MQLDKNCDLCSGKCRRNSRRKLLDNQSESKENSGKSRNAKQLSVMELRKRKETLVKLRKFVIET
jgi:hypothetical protein